ncbi:MAG: hypothetical protein ACREU7_04100, partial [Burkholderiales bacterium]
MLEIRSGVACRSLAAFPINHSDEENVMNKGYRRFRLMATASAFGLALMASPLAVDLEQLKLRPSLALADVIASASSEATGDATVGAGEGTGGDVGAQANAASDAGASAGSDGASAEASGSDG